MSNTSDKDFLLKQKMMRYFWRLGYYVRPNVRLTRDTEGGKTDITDIDVLAVKVSNNFNVNFAICDCKSGKKVSNSERLLWLSGLKQYFNTNNAYFVRNSIIAEDYQEMLNVLGISCITVDHLDWLEDVFNIEKTDFFGPFSNNHNEIVKKYNEINNKTTYNLDYLLIDYWRNKPHEQILQIMSICRILNSLETLDKKDKEFILSYCHSLLSLSIIRFCNAVFNIPTENKEDYIKEELLGGKLTYNEKTSLVGTFYDFMIKEIEKRYKEKYPIGKKEFVSKIVPDYKPYIVDFIIRLLNYPECSFIIPRFLDIMFYDNIVADKEIDFCKIFYGINSNKISLKPVKDFRVFLERSNIITDELNERYKIQITLFEAYLESL